MAAWGSPQQHRKMWGLSAAPNQAWGCPCHALARGFLHPISPHTPSALLQPCLAQHPVLNPSPPLQTQGRSLRQSGSGQCWGCLAQPAPHIPPGQPCPPAPWLKSIIQIILAWRHGSVAVTNSSEARRARAHALCVITGAGARLLPQPPPHTETPRQHPHPEVSPRYITLWAQCSWLMLDAAAQFIGARPGPVPPATACAVS